MDDNIEMDKLANKFRDDPLIQNYRRRTKRFTVLHLYDENEIMINDI